MGNVITVLCLLLNANPPFLRFLLFFGSLMAIAVIIRNHCVLQQVYALEMVSLLSLQPCQFWDADVQPQYGNHNVPEHIFHTVFCIKAKLLK